MEPRELKVVIDLVAIAEKVLKMATKSNLDLAIENVEIDIEKELKPAIDNGKLLISLYIPATQPNLL